MKSEVFRSHVEPEPTGVAPSFPLKLHIGVRDNPPPSTPLVAGVSDCRIIILRHGKGSPFELDSNPFAGWQPPLFPSAAPLAPSLPPQHLAVYTLFSYFHFQPKYSSTFFGLFKIFLSSSLAPLSTSLSGPPPDPPPLSISHLVPSHSGVLHVYAREDTRIPCTRVHHHCEYHFVLSFWRPVVPTSPPPPPQKRYRERARPPQGRQLFSSTVQRVRRRDRCLLRPFPSLLHPLAFNNLSPRRFVFSGVGVQQPGPDCKLHDPASATPLST